MASEIGLRTSLLSNVIDVAPAKRLGSSGSMEPEIWTENWRRNEFSYLRDRLELVERQLRRRTALLAVAVTGGRLAGGVPVTVTLLVTGPGSNPSVTGSARVCTTLWPGCNVTGAGRSAPKRVSLATTLLSVVLPLLVTVKV